MLPFYKQQKQGNTYNYKPSKSSNTNESEEHNENNTSHVTNTDTTISGDYGCQLQYDEDIILHEQNHNKSVNSAVSKRLESRKEMIAEGLKKHKDFDNLVRKLKLKRRNDYDVI